MKRLLIVAIGAMMLVACSSNSDEADVKAEVEPEVVPVVSEEVEADSLDEQEQNEDEGIHRVTNIDLDAFIESYNSLAEDAGIETFERDENDSIVADGLLISMNEDGTVWGIVQPTLGVPLSIVSTLLAIKSQSNNEDSEKIDALLEGFAKAIDDKEGLFIESINIESMEISLSTVNAEILLFHVLGDEQS